MKLSEFIVLGETEKAKAVVSKGVLVAKTKAAPQVNFLFQMDCYYVEMCCNASNKTITEFNAYTSTAPLAPYLEQIPLTDVL